jgi:hypothetical protein
MKPIIRGIRITHLAHRYLATQNTSNLNHTLISWTDEDSEQLNHLKQKLLNHAFPLRPLKALLYIHLPASVLAIWARDHGSDGSDIAMGLFFFNIVAFGSWFAPGNNGMMTVNGTRWDMGGPLSNFVLNLAMEEIRADPTMAEIVKKHDALIDKRTKHKQQEHDKYLNRQV